MVPRPCMLLLGCGSPAQEASWPETILSKLEGAGVSAACADLIHQLMRMRQQDRISVENVLHHPWVLGK